MRGVAQMPANDLDEIGIALGRPDGGKLRHDPEGEPSNPETKTKTKRRRERAIEDGDSARRAAEQDRFGQGAMDGNAKASGRAAILNEGVLHQISAPPPKEKKERKKLDAAKAMERPKTICTSRRKPPDVSPKPVVNGRCIYVVANETTVGENFAERWNTEPARVAAFYEWHAKALADFDALPDLQGIDIIGKSLESSLGSSVVRKVMDARTESISQARTAKKLYVAPTVGLTLSNTAHATPVRSNTFFGD